MSQAAGSNKRDGGAASPSSTALQGYRRQGLHDSVLYYCVIIGVIVVVVIAHQFLFLSCIVTVDYVMLDDAGDDTRRVREKGGYGVSRCARRTVVGRRDVDMSCQGLLLTFFRRQVNQLAVGSATKTRLHQNCYRHHLGYIVLLMLMTHCHETCARNFHKVFLLVSSVRF